MVANGVMAFDERVFRPLPQEMLRYVVMGLPDQFITVRPTSSGNAAVLVNPTLVPLDRAEPPADMVTSFPRFYGRLAGNVQNPHTGVSLAGMSGFSGGPILGFKDGEDGQVRYYLVAIQSGWRPDLRVVAGPLMPAIAAWIQAQVRDGTAEASS
jgi:hypothetical protein